MRCLILITLFIGSLFLAGCGFPNERTIDRPMAKSVEKTPDESLMVTDPMAEKMQRRFDPAMQDADDSGQSPIELARSYEELSVKTNALRETNSELTLKNNQLKRQIEMLKSEMEQTKKDMAEANDFLGQMHLELNKWKSDVLGFRQEIRQAQQAQLEALGKILRVLGAEPVELLASPEESSSDSRESK